MDASTATAVVSHSAQVLAGLNSVIDKADHLITSPVLIHLVSWGVSIFGCGGCFKWFKNRQVEKAAHVAFMAVEEAARREPNNETLKKADLFVEHFEALMKH